MRRLRRLLAVRVSKTAVSATVPQAERDQHEAGDRGQLSGRSGYCGRRVDGLLVQI
jgi:hypothetical protein